MMDSMAVEAAVRYIGKVSHDGVVGILEYGCQRSESGLPLESGMCNRTGSATNQFDHSFLAQRGHLALGVSFLVIAHSHFVRDGITKINNSFVGLPVP